MKINDLEHKELILTSTELIIGSAYTYVSGYASTATGVADAGIFSKAVGLKTFTHAGTSAQTFINPYFSTSNAVAMGSAIATDYTVKSSSSFYGTSHNTSFMGSSMTIGGGIISSTYKSW